MSSHLSIIIIPFNYWEHVSPLKASPNGIFLDKNSKVPSEEPFLFHSQNTSLPTLWFPMVFVQNVTKVSLLTGQHSFP